MGIRGDPKAKQPSSEQVRMARLTLEGNSADDESTNIHKMIKKVIEMTACTQAQAEIALLDFDNDMNAAVDHILETGNLESWTEQKGAKKEKKKQDEDRNASRSFVQRGRGSGGFAERSSRGRGTSNGGPREAPSGGQSRGGRGGFDRPSTFSGRGGRGGGTARGGYARAVAPVEPSFLDENKPEANEVKVDTNVTEVQPSAVESTTATVTTSSAPAPISFAAVAAAAHRKEEQRRQQFQQPQTTAKPQRSLSPVPAPAVVEEEPAIIDEPESSQDNQENTFYQSEASVIDEPVATVSDEPEEVPIVEESSNQSNAWTKQLKSELGIGLPETTSTGGILLSPSPMQSANVSIQSLPDPGVEFVGGAEPTGLADYSFGFVDTPPTPIIAAETSAASISTNSSDNLFNSSRVSVQSKPVEQERAPMSNGDFNLKSSSPPNPYAPPNRTLSYDTSSVSYAPSTDRGLSSNKASFNPSSQLPIQQQQPQQQAPQPPQPQQSQQHHPQQTPLMFPPQLPYNPYSYMNMYSPVTGVRDEQYAALMQYGMGVDLANLSTILPQSAPISQAAPSQQIPSGQHRGDSHGLMDLNKFGSQSSRDQQQPSNVGPPPGFQTTPYMQQPNLSSLFMQQPYPTAHQFGFMNMMPSVGNTGGGRQMYSQDDERKTYDKMSSKPSTQQNPHSQYQHNGGNLGMYSKNKTYNNWGN